MFINIGNDFINLDKVLHLEVYTRADVDKVILHAIYPSEDIEILVPDLTEEEQEKLINRVYMTLYNSVGCKII